MEKSQQKCYGRGENIDAISSTEVQTLIDNIETPGANEKVERFIEEWTEEDNSGETVISEADALISISSSGIYDTIITRGNSGNFVLSVFIRRDQNFPTEARRALDYFNEINILVRDSNGDVLERRNLAEEQIFQGNFININSVEYIEYSIIRGFNAPALATVTLEREITISTFTASEKIKILSKNIVGDLSNNNNNENLSTSISERINTLVFSQVLANFADNIIATIPTPEDIEDITIFNKRVVGNEVFFDVPSNKFVDRVDIAPPTGDLVSKKPTLIGYETFDGNFVKTYKFGIGTLDSQDALRFTAEGGRGNYTNEI